MRTATNRLTEFEYGEYIYTNVILPGYNIGYNITCSGIINCCNEAGQCENATEDTLPYACGCRTAALSEGPSMSSSPTQVPSGIPSVSLFPTNRPTLSPVTDSPSLSPVTDSPTLSPVTDSPSLSPVTNSPTLSPVQPTVSYVLFNILL